MDKSHYYPIVFAIPLFLSLLLPALTSHAALNDVLPGDYYPLQSDQTTLTVCAYDRELQRPYASGRKTLDGLTESTVLALRAARFFQIGDIMLAGVAVLPWSDSQTNPAPLATALGAKAKIHALAGYLRWRVNPAWHVHAGGQRNWGGETSINGVDQSNPANMSGGWPA